MLSLGTLALSYTAGPALLLSGSVFQVRAQTKTANRHACSHLGEAVA